MIEVTQADREAAANHLQAITEDGHSYDAIRRGQCDNHPLVQAFAAHRIAAEKAVLGMLDTMPMNPVIDMAFEKWRVLLTGDMVREIVRAALEAKP